MAIESGALQPARSERFPFAPSHTTILRRAYAASLPQRLAELQRTWSEVDAAGASPAVEGLLAAAWRLSGSAVSYGYDELGEKAGELGRLLMAGRDPWTGEDFPARVHAQLTAIGLAVWEICFLAE